ncbi:TIGR02099 family protein [Marinihelvus fidelis]|uniref:TIGR02099 family protein n=1 Tax=Marinihelvus fidelis TaxID=2613842 RepID=A0A5N0T8T6_9GAMM|nr:YhdP family protein [Marinihelvus fidelis]KAA9130246.1 TIGR02099 family protein [Marinihelvus fidelis]
MKRWRIWWRRARSILWTALTLVVLLAAIMVGLGKLLMPYSTQFKPRLEAWLSEEFNQPVRVGSFTGEWKAFGPRISLRDLELLGGTDSDGDIALREAGLDIRPLNVLLPNRPLYAFRIIGADLVLSRGDDGRFALSGLGVSGRGDGSGGGLGTLARLGEVALVTSRLAYRDPARGVALQLVDVDGRMQLAMDRVALQVQAAVADDSQGHVLGDVGATAVVALDDEGRVSAIDWHAETGEFLLSQLTRGLPDHALLPESGRVNAQVWGEWAPGQPQRMQGVLDVRDVELGEGDGLIAVDHINSRFQWRSEHRQRWRLDLGDVRIAEGGRDWVVGALAVERNIPDGLGIWVGADYLRAAMPMALTQRIMANFNARWPRNVPTAADGEITDFDIVINADKKFVGAWGELIDISATEWGKWPDVSGINGQVALLNGHGVAHISGEAVEVNWPRNFRSPALIEIPGCRFDMTWGARWQVDVADCHGGNEAASLEARLRFTQSEGRPFVDLAVGTDHLDIAALGDYWPAALLKPPVLAWMDRAIEGGTVNAGHFLLRGDLDDFPFRGNEGVLDARASVVGGELAVHTGWPLASGVDIDLRFLGVGMSAQGSITDFGGVPVPAATASITDFQRARLDIGFEGDTTLPRLATFLQSTPLLADSELDLDGMTFEGPASVDGEVRIPLGSTPGELQVDGRLALGGNAFSEDRSGVRLENVAGRVNFNRSGFEGRDLAATWQAHPARLDLVADWGGEQPFRANLSGYFPAAELVAATPAADEPMLSRLQGMAQWDVGFEVGDRNPESGERDLWLHVNSDLVDVSMDLPAPLTKTVGTVRPLEMRWPLKSSRRVIDARLGGVGSLRAELGDDGETLTRVAVALNEGPANLPDPGQWLLTGHVDRLDLDEWLDAIIEAVPDRRQAAPLRFAASDLRTDQLVFMNREFPDATLQITQPGEAVEVRVDSARLTGDIRYQSNVGGTHSLSAQMDNVDMPKPLSEGITMDSDPTQLPEFHIFVQDLRYHGVALGETRIEAYPVADGLRIESMEAASDHMTFQARGDWVTTGAGSRSDFDILLTAENLGDLVSAMELSTLLEGGQTMIHYDAWWPGPPAAFELAQLNGLMNFTITDGRVLDAEPGAGRVLGLFSVAALPRRLSLDFRDVFESGFNFDTAGANISLESGVARTDDFIMESTAATLAIEGSTDLVNQQFDYRMTVRPGVSQALPVIGALAAGPPGAAAGLALQGLLRDALGNAAEARYSIVGPWAEPEVTRLEAPQTAAGDADTTEPPGP